MSSSAEPNLICIYPHQADQFWPHVEPLLKIAVERCGEWSIGELKSEINKGALLWITFDGERVDMAAVSRVVLSRGEKICQLLAAGGSEPHWNDRIAEVEKYARLEGCARMQLSGRKGWLRVFNDYDLVWVTIEKRLD